VSLILGDDRRSIIKGEIYILLFRTPSEVVENDIMILVRGNDKGVFEE